MANVGGDCNCGGGNRVVGYSPDSTRGGASMTVEEFISLVEEVHSDFQGEEEQALLQRDLHKAEMALAGKYACDRVLRKIEARARISLVRSRPMGRAR